MDAFISCPKNKKWSIIKKCQSSDCLVLSFQSKRASWLVARRTVRGLPGVARPMSSSKLFRYALTFICYFLFSRFFQFSHIFNCQCLGGPGHTPSKRSQERRARAFRRHECVIFQSARSDLRQHHEVKSIHNGKGRREADSPDHFFCSQAQEKRVKNKRLLTWVKFKEALSPP